MKEYDIYKLYVVEIKNNDDTYFFICKLDIFTNNYIDIITNNKISKSNISKVEPFSNYYAFIKKRNVLNKKITIDEVELLRIYKEINCKGDKYDEQVKNSVLDKATINFFPKTGNWYSSCFDRPKYLDKDCLPSNLRDDLWLAKMIKIDQKLFNLSIKTILEYIKTSPFFKEQRHKYEQEIVKWQMEWIKSGGENWIVDEEYGGEFYLLGPYCDLAFRKGVVDTLLEIGMDREAIEEGLEKNADMWRDSYINRAFLNKYNSPLFHFNYNVFNEDKSNKNEIKEPLLEKYDLLFKENWIKMRKYEYYQRHKNSVDKYGSIESCMLMSDEEVYELRIYLKEKDIERKNQLSKYEVSRRIKSRRYY